MDCPICGRLGEKEAVGWWVCPCGVQFNPDLRLAYKLLDPNMKIRVTITDTPATPQ